MADITAEDVDSAGHQYSLFYAPASKDQGHIVLPLSIYLSVWLSARLSVCTNLTWKLDIFPLLLN